MDSFGRLLQGQYPYIRLANHAREGPRKQRLEDFGSEGNLS